MDIWRGAVTRPFKNPVTGANEPFFYYSVGHHVLYERPMYLGRPYLQPGFLLEGRLMLSTFYMILGTMQVFNIHEVILKKKKVKIPSSILHSTSNKEKQRNGVGL